MRWPLFLLLALAGAASAQMPWIVTPGDEASRLLDSLSTATETQSLDIARESAQLDDPSDRERLRLAAALRLSDVGTSESLPLLAQWSNEATEIQTLIDGCRRPVLAPLFDFPTASALARERIECRTEALSLKADARSSGWEPLLRRMDVPPEVWARALADLTTDEARRLLRSDLQGSAAVAELILRGDAIPSDEVLALLDDPAIERLYRERERLSNATRTRLAVQLAPVSSAWRMESAPVEGTEGVLAAQKSGNKTVQWASERDAVLALMLADTPESRDQLRGMKLSAPLSEEAHRWLAGR